MDIYPAYSDGTAYRIEFFGDEVDRITEIDTVTGRIQGPAGPCGHFPCLPLCGAQGKDDGGHGTYPGGAEGAGGLL